MKDQDKTKEQLMDELQEMRQRVAELEVSEAERNRAEERIKFLAEVLSTSPLSVGATDKGGKIIYVNPATERLFGYRSDELLGKNPIILNADPNADKIQRDILGTIGQGRVWRGEILNKKKNGEVFSIYASVYQLLDEEGNFIALVGFQEDITERKRAEEALRASEERCRAIFEQAADAIVLVDGETGALVQFNDRAHENLGYTREEFEELKIQDFEVIESADEVAKHIEKIIRDGADTFETKHRTKDGDIRDVHVSCRALSIGGRDFVQSIWRDITDRKRAEEAYRTLVDHSLQGLVILRDARVLFTNQAFADISGYTVDELLAMSPEEVQAFVHPDDRELVWGRHWDRLKGKPLPQRYEFRGVRKDGSICWLEIHANLIDFQGKPAVQAAYVDITDRKKAEDALRLHSEITMNMSQGVYLIRARDGVIIYTNPKFGEIFAYSPGEMIGKHVSVVNAPTEKSPEETTKEIMQFIAQNGFWRGEIQNIKKDGTPFWCYASVSTFEHPEHGTVLLSVHTDITDRKQAEEQIRNLAKFPSENPNPVLRITRDGTVLHANPAGLPLLEDWNCGIGRLVPGPWRELLAHVFASRSNERLEEQHRNRILSFEVVPVTDSGYVNLYARDITERKRAEEALRESEEGERDFSAKLKALNEVGNKLSTAESVDEMCRFGVELGRSRLGFDRLGIWLLDQTNPDFVMGTWGTDEKGQLRDERQSRLSIDANEVIRSVLLRKNRLALFSDAPLFDDRAEVIGRGTNVAAPLWDGEQVIGYVSMDNLLQRQPITERQCELVTLYASTLGHLCTRKRVETALKDSESLYQSLVESLPQNILRKDMEGRFTFANTNFLSALGRPLHQVVGRTDFDFYPAKLAEKYSQDDRKVIEAEEIFEDVEEHQTPDGQRLYVQVVKTPVYDAEGKVIGVQGIFWDVTERKRVETALKDSESLYQSLVESLPQNILRKDMEGRFTFANTNFLSTLGKPLHEVVGRTDYDFYPAELAEKYSQDDRKVIEAEEIFEDVEEHQTPDGQRLYVQVVKTPVRDAGGKVIGVQGIFWDITKRKRAEEERKALGRLARRLAGAASLKNVVAIAREESDRLLGWDAYYLAMGWQGEDSLQVMSFVDTVDGQKKVFGSQDWPGADVSAPVRQVLDGRPVLINRTPGDPKPVLSRFGNEDRPSASLMFVPVRSRNNVIGILCVQSYTYDRYDEADLQTLQRIGDGVAPALERAYAEASLRESEERFRRLYDEAPVGYHEIDNKGNIVRVNRTECDLLGYTRDEMLGRPVFEFLVPEEQQKARQAVTEKIQKKRRLQIFERTLLAREGRQIPAAIQDRLVLDNRGRVTGIRSTVLDITEQKKAEEEKRGLQEQLALAQKMEALGTLAGGVAHEYNNIVAAIIGYVDLTLQTEELSDTARRNLKVVRTSGARAADLTRSLLTFSRKHVGEKKLVNLRDVAEKVLEVTEKEFTTQGIEVTASHSTKVPPVMANAPMLESVVMNLVVNARHAILNSDVKKLTVQTGVERGRPFIRVKDTGCGIPEEDVPRIFDPFFTTKGSLVSGKVYDGKARGTGLGLSVCHSIIEGHGGEIKVKSRVGKGATFTVYLPAAPRRKTTRPEVEAKRKEGVSRIMVVDDEEAITDLLVDMLGQAGYEALGFTNPEEAAKALRREQYALAFIDLQMPEMNGEDFIEMVNTLPLEKRPLTVILTGRLDVFGKDYSNLNVFSTLLKPFETQQVLDIVDKALAARGQPAGRKEDSGKEASEET